VSGNVFDAAISRLRRILVPRPDPGAGIALFLTAHAAAALFLFWQASQARFCCDATDYYLPAGVAIWRDGLLWDDPYAGYRFYLVPLVFGLLERLPWMASEPSAISHQFPYALAGAYMLTSLAASYRVFRRESWQRWLLFVPPVLCNPFLLAIVPYPLQERVVAIFALPLLVVLLADTHLTLRGLAIIAALSFGLLVVSRPSLAWMALPIALCVFYRGIALRSSAKTFVFAASAGIAILSILLAPQAYIAMKAPPQNAREWVLRAQLVDGIDMFDYTTGYDATHFFPVPAWSPFRNMPSEEKNLSFYGSHPEHGFVVAATHVWAGLHYMAPTPYVPKTSFRLFSPWLIASACVVGYGLIGLAGWWRARDDRGIVLFLTATVALSCMYTALTATEGRFGLLGFLALSVAAWKYLSTSPRKPELAVTAPLVIAYVVLCIAFGALLLYRTPLLAAESLGSIGPSVGALSVR